MTAPTPTTLAHHAYAHATRDLVRQRRLRDREGGRRAHDWRRALEAAFGDAVAKRR